MTDGSPWWSDATRDPWRDPEAPTAVVSYSPPVPPPAVPQASDVTPARGGLGATLLVVVVTALLAGSLGGAVGFVAASRNITPAVTLGAGSGTPPALAQRAPTSLAGVVSRVMPSVVTVTATNASGTSLGSGFVITADGYVLTNEHVITNVPDDAVTVTFADSSTAPAKVVGRDVESDLAVLRVARHNLAPVEFGDSDAVAVGDPVLAVGSPLALAGTVTAGIISALDRTIETDDSGSPRYYAAIQTDAAINHGNSGGPLFDAAGRVIGINSVIKSVSGSDAEAGSIGLAFAIPINQARRIAEQIIDTGRAHRTVIGAELDPTAYATGGARLLGVDNGGPAARAGLRTGDVILRLGGHVIDQSTDLIALVRRYDPGTILTVTYRRGAATETTQVTLAADAN